MAGAFKYATLVIALPVAAIFPRLADQPRMARGTLALIGITGSTEGGKSRLGKPGLQAHW